MILNSSFQGVSKECLAQWPAFCVPNTTKKSGGVLPEKLGGGLQHPSWNPYPISDQNSWFSLLYFRPDQKFDILFETWNPGAWCMTGACDKLLWHIQVVGVNIKREMVLSPNDEEVANSSKKHTQFKTRVHKPYPISDQNGRNWYPISDQNGWKAIPFGASHTHGYSIIYKGLPSRQKMRCRLWVLLLTQARRINTNVVCSLNYCMENLRGGQNSTTTKYFWDVDTLHQLFTLSFKPKIDVHVPILRRKTKFSWGWLWLGLETQQYLTCMQF